MERAFLSQAMQAFTDPFTQPPLALMTTENPLIFYSETYYGVVVVFWWREIYLYTVVCVWYKHSNPTLFEEEKMVHFTGKSVLLIKLSVLLLLIFGGLAATAQSAQTEHFASTEMLEECSSKGTVVETRMF